MLTDKPRLDVDNVTGRTFLEAQSTMQQIEYAISQRVGKGFDSLEACAGFARDFHMDIMVYMKSLGNFRHVNHWGDTLTSTEWRRMYRQILFYPVTDAKGAVKRVAWANDDYESFKRARLYGEHMDGKYPPLYHRDYFTPTGYYDESTGTFNVARPVPVFARNTGADTEFIHTLLRAISGECYPYLLAWLRAKMMWPCRKTEVVPIFTGGQGAGKSSFGEAICKAMFGESNVLVTDQFDATARFNADNADALIISIEEKSQEDKRNTSATLKSRATATQVRKENKGVDPFYQESYTDFVLSTNEHVPLKFEDRGEQRRFMVMEADPGFTRERSRLADEVFTKLYGYTAEGVQVCPGLAENKSAVEQFKWELLNQKNCEGINYRQFPKTAAYHRCFSIPRTNEAVDIETLLRALCPFIKASLLEKKIVHNIKITENDNNGEDKEKAIMLSSIVQDIHALQFIKCYGSRPDRVALCRALVFYDSLSNKPYAHSVVERTLLDMQQWFIDEYGLELMPETHHPESGFKGLGSKFRWGTATWFTLAGAETAAQKTERIRREEAELKRLIIEQKTEAVRSQGAILESVMEGEDNERSGVDSYSLHDNRRGNTGGKFRQQPMIRLGQRVRFNSKFVPDPKGEFETLNELKPGCSDRRKENAQYLDTFLLESDNATKLQLQDEANFIREHAGEQFIDAESLYKKRLAVQDMEAERLFKEGIVARVVYSGSKSMHMLVRVEDSPRLLKEPGKEYQEREWLDAYLKATLSDKLVFDKVTKDPARLTRAPQEFKRMKLLDPMDYDGMLDDIRFPAEGVYIVGKQRLLAQNWNHIYRLNWRPIYDQWLHQPPAFYERGSKLMPTKPLYKEAVASLLESKDFFTDARWNGLRQEAFFPAYRLMRAMGWEHEELWQEITPQIDGYGKVKERDYWRTREYCDLIKIIDKEYDEDDA